MCTFYAKIDGGLQVVKGGVIPLTLVGHVLVAKRARESHVNLPLENDLQW